MPTHAISVDEIPADPSTGNVATQVSISQLTVTLTDEQIKALPTTPVEIVPSPGEGKWLQVLSVIVVPSFAVQYANFGATNAYITPIYEPDGEFMGYLLNEQVAILLGGTEDKYHIFYPKPFDNEWGTSAIRIPKSSVENKALQFYFDNAGSGNITGGDPSNTLKITTVYSTLSI